LQHSYRPNAKPTQISQIEKGIGLKMRIAVIDGQGGGIGKAIIEKLRLVMGNDLEVIALGTNALATSLMIKAGANEGASGENAIVVNADKVDVIIGTISVIAVNSMLGELTAKMAMSISESSALKILIPLNRCNIQIAGSKNEPLPHYIENAIQILKKYMEDEKNV
jgi:hypothetical protein